MLPTAPSAFVIGMVLAKNRMITLYEHERRKKEIAGWLMVVAIWWCIGDRRSTIGGVNDVDAIGTSNDDDDDNADSGQLMALTTTTAEVGLVCTL